MTMNLDSRVVVPTAAFNPTDKTSFNSSTSSTIYDSLGEPHILTMYFRKTGAATDNDWQVFAQLDNNNAVPATTTGAVTAVLVMCPITAAAGTGF